METHRSSLPASGSSKESVLETMKARRQDDVKWREGRAWSLVFNAGDEVADVLRQAYSLFLSENALNPTAFPSLRRFETEVVSMTAGLLGGDEHVVGSMTSGGTESILMTVKTAREWARTTGRLPAHATPEMVLPMTAHPAFEKAGHYFGVKPVHASVCPDFRANVEACRAAITPNTVLLVGSAPSYPHGVIDPIAALAEIARDKDILLHVDACVGGFILPFVRRLGYAIADFDFRVPGVTSISVDLHKYGYAAKGASVILYRDRDLRRRQFFVYTDWPGGIYASPSMTGTRPGGAIAAAWAVMHYLGDDGYLALADTVMKTAVKLREGIAAIDGVEILGDPDLSLLAIGSKRLDVYEVADEMAERGWHLDRQQSPPSLHLTVMPAHAQVADLFLTDLAEAVAAVKRPSLRKAGTVLLLKLAEAAVRVLPESLVSRLTSKVSSLLGGEESGLPRRSAAMYGLMGSLPNRGDLHELVLDLLDQLTRPSA